MTAIAVTLAALVATQVGAGQSMPRIDTTSASSSVPELVAPWVYPKARTVRLIEQNIVPREMDILRMHTTDPAEVVEAYYRSLAVGDSGAYSIVSAVNQRIVANGSTVVTIESDGRSTVITVVASEPDRESSPKSPFPVRKQSFRPPPS